MTVSIISSGTINGAQFADSLSGGGTGKTLGSSEAGQAAPEYDIFIRHDGVTKIINFSVYIKSYSQAYGGEYSASMDLIKAIDQGNIGYGVQIDFDWQAPVPFATKTIITAGIGGSQLTAIEVPVTAILRNVGGVPTPAVAPVQGEIGPAGEEDGDTVKLKLRWVVPLSETAPGRRQIDLAYIYNFTT